MIWIVATEDAEARADTLKEAMRSEKVKILVWCLHIGSRHITYESRCYPARDAAYRACVRRTIRRFPPRTVDPIYDYEWRARCVDSHCACASGTAAVRGGK